jgi:hypothetical protein
MSDSTASSSSNVTSTQSTGASTAAQSTSASSAAKSPSPASQLPASTHISSLSNLQSLDSNMFNQWMVLFAQALIVDGQSYERRVEDAMRHLRDGEE